MPFSSKRSGPETERSSDHSGDGAGADQPGQRTREAGEQARARARQEAERGREQLAESTNRLRRQGRDAVLQGKTRAADRVDQWRDTTRRVADTFQQKGDAQLADYTNTLAGQIDSAGQYLRDRHLEGIRDDAGRVVRGRPEVILGGLFIAGLGLARFLKASDRPDRHAARNAEAATSPARAEPAGSPAPQSPEPRPDTGRL